MISDEVVNDKPPSQRGIAMVFQSYALYPHLTVFENMAFSLRIAKVPKDKITKIINETAVILQLEDYLHRLPKALSGGQRQRVAIGRAIVRNPKVFLFDEPLSNLDSALRSATRIEIANLKDSLPDTTMIYVTHDQVEAMTLADRIVVLSSGDVEQVGTPLELYENPANLFVATFIGSPAMNIIDATISSANGKINVTLSDDNKFHIDNKIKIDQSEMQVKIGIRPEDMYITGDNDQSITGKVMLVETLGEYSLIYTELPGVSINEHMIVKTAGVAKLHKGDSIKLGIPVEKIHIFNSDGRVITS